MSGRVCPYCELAWPTDAEYKRCPRCHESTVYASRADGMEWLEAYKLSREEEFGWYLLNQWLTA